MLVAHSQTPFGEGYILNYDRFPFVLKYLCNWDSRFQKLLDRGNHDSSDMQGPGYLISEEGRVYCDNIFDYDSWEYFEGELQGAERILKGVSSLMQEKIGIDLFLDAYQYMQNEEKPTLDIYTEEGLKLAGLTEIEDKK